MGCSVTIATRPGTGRPRSDDACTWRERDGLLVAAMADGVGSARAGGDAADRATRRLVENFEARPVDWTLDRALVEFATQINRQLCEEAVARYGSEGALACTLAAVAVSGDTLWGLNVGDTEVQLWRDGQVRRLSERHTLAGPECSHVLTRVLGVERQIAPHAFSWRLAAGDRVLLCTDGVTGALPPDRLAELLGRRADADAILRAAGSPADDATALVIDVAAPGALQAATPARLHVPAALRAGETWAGHILARPLDPDGRVWLARRLADGAERVLKFPPADARHDPHIHALFSREIAYARRLRAPFFPEASVPDEDPVSCYSLAYLPAPTLRECLRDRPLATEEVIALGRFLAGAAQFLLRHDLVHGDIKPENILVRSRGAEAAFTLLDFGSVAPLFAPPSRAGTASYLAPERFAGAPHSERTELFGIGVTLFEATTRTYPYGEIERFQNPRFPAPRLPSRLNPAVPAWLESALLRSVATDPERRYQHYSQLMFDLEHPAKVEPFFAADTPLFERHPRLAWQLVAAALAVLNLFQLWTRR